MASCGTPTLCPEQRKASKCCSDTNQSLFKKRWRSRACAVLGLAVVALLVGCAPTVKFGSPPRTDHLDTLKVGASSKADVLLALGEPRGNGVTRLSAEATPRTIWFYEYTETAGKVADLKILLVFFDQDKYDGHLSFSSIQELPKAQ